MHSKYIASNDKTEYYTQNKNIAKKNPQPVRKLQILHKRGQDECKNQRVGRSAMKYEICCPLEVT